MFLRAEGKKKGGIWQKNDVFLLTPHNFNVRKTFFYGFMVEMLIY